MITLTDAALVELKRSMKKYGYEDCCYYLKVAITGSGSLGLEYKIQFIQKQEYIDNYDNYVEQEQDGLHIVVDKESDLYMNGTIMHWDRDGFVFNNPFTTECKL